MSTAQELDYSTLKWVKSEIDENLKQTRQALEAYVENPEDATQLRFCITYLHQIYGTLQMVEIYGGALLAEEMEKITLALIEDKVTQKDAAYDVIMRAILQLPSYLEHLEAGEQDRPVILLPLLNDLRAARGETLLSENAFFSPNLTIDAPIDEDEKKVDKAVNLSVYAKKLRSVFQSSLVGLYRGETPKANLRKIGAVFKELLVHSESPSAKRLWWVSGGVIEALFTGGLESNIHIKQLISQIDGEIKRVIAEGDQCFDESPPTELLKNLLFYVASSKTGGKRVDQLKKLFDLDKLIPSGGDISQLFERLRGSNQELLSSVSAVVKEDLLQIKDQLDGFVRSEDRSVEQLASFSEQISRISDTLAMLGLGDLHKILQDQKKNISAMVASGERPNEAHLMEIASALLYIESSLDSIEASDIGKEADESANAAESGSVSIPASQRKQLNKFVLAEACEVLGKVKESFNTYATNSSDNSIISDVPRLLNHVKGVLSVLMLERPAKLLHVTVRYISEEIIEKNNIPNAAALDEIADLITSVEYYLEAVTDSRGNIDSILDIAEQSVKKLGYSLETIDYLQPLDVESSVSDSGEKKTTKVVNARSDTDSKMVDRAEKNLDFNPANSNLAVDLDPKPSEETTPVAAAPTPAISYTSDDEIDEEILEIFIEEADEILGSMHDNLQTWKLNSSDTDSLLVLRRSYHTIKGSGRLAGANKVGDFAWGVENILNKIIESKLEVTPALFQLMDESESAIVLLINQLKGQEVELPDIADLTRRAEAFCDASGATAPKHQPIEAAPAPVEQPVSNDAKLADIFKKEARVHIETVRNYLDVFAQSDINTVAEPLMRALHTLHGSARVAKATSISVLSEPLDKYFTVLYETQTPISTESVRLLEEIVTVIEPMAKVFDGVSNSDEPDNMEQLLEAVAVEFNRVKESAQKALKVTLSKGIAEAAAEQELLEKNNQASEQDPLNKLIDVDATLDLPTRKNVSDTVIEDSKLEISTDEFTPEAAKENVTYPIDIAMGSSVDTDIDPELALIFVQEAGEILSNIAEILEEWTENSSDIPIMEELQRTLHTLRSGAKMTRQTAINELCDQMERALSHYVMSNIDPGQLVTTLFRECHSWLVSAISDIHKIGEHAPKEFINRLLSISEVAQTSESQGTLADPVDQPTIEMPVPDFENSLTQDSMPNISIPEGSVTPPDFSVSDEEHVDQELVGIFLEEATELTLQTEKVLDGILSDPTNVENLAALKRLLHTLKGGARMAGVMSIANVTHTVETVLEQVIECEQQIDDKAIKLLLAFNEWINDAVGQVGHGQLVLLPPAKLIHEIENLLQNAPVSKGRESIGLGSEEIDNIDLAEHADAIDEIVLDQIVLEGDSSQIDSILGEDAAVVMDTDESVPVDPTPIEVSEISIPEFNVDTSQSSLARSNSADDEDDDDDLTDIFLEEADEIQESMEDILTEWQNDVSNNDYIMQMQRALHTLKGGARMAGIESVGDLSHAIESLLEDVIEKGLVPTAQFPEAVQLCHDWLVHAIAQLKAGHDARKIVQLVKRLGNLRQGNDMNLGVTQESLESAAAIQPTIETIENIEAEREEVVPVAPIDIANLIQVPTSTPKHDASEVPVFRTSPRNPDEQIRVKADLIDTMVNHAGEMNIYNSRIEQQFNGWQFNLTEMTQTVQRLHEQLRKFEIEAETQIMYRHSGDSNDENADFDPLELDRFSVMQQLSRGMVESLGDLHSIQTALDDITNDADVLLLQQSRINTDLHQGLMRTRLTPFSSVTARLKRIVRQTCQELGKEANLNIIGADGEMDRSQLNRVVPALEHILRNAVDHGLELPKQRAKAKKPAEGEIQLDFGREGSEIVIRISDDGMGINLDLLRKKAIERELIRPDTKLPDHELIEFILESGFSTATNVTQISGRGVGMDVVNNEIKQLNGSLHIDTSKNKGSVFTIRLPLTVLVNQALMLSVNESKYALPLSGIEHIIRVSGKELNALNSGKQKYFEYAGNKYDNLNLHQILHGIRQKPTEDKLKLPLILAHSGDQRVALHIDQILGRNEIVIKSVGPQLSSLANISGATILPDGGVALILDITSLIRSSHTMQLMLDSGALVVEDMMSAVEEQTRPLVMIVDDSITVRKVTERLLKRNNYDTITAKDGVDALTVLLEQLPDIMLLDVEMPRMDGFELATTMRNDARLKSIPIIMITSRTGDKHKDRAFKIGVNDYMGKPYQEQDLIRNITTLLASGKEKEL